MIFSFNKKSIPSIVIALTLVIISGCSSASKVSSNNTITNEASNNINTKTNASSKNSSTNGVTKSPDPQDNSQIALLNSILPLAQQGKIINCDFAAKSTTIDTVKATWGKATTSMWVAQAKGLYSTYSKHNVVFGSNKGDQIFEVRSLDSSLKQISLSMVKSVFGTPAHNAKSNGEQIIGYVAGTEFKILFVFSKPAKGNNDPMLNHYSVLYPAGTVNNMAGDPGRQW